MRIVHNVKERCEHLTALPGKSQLNMCTKYNLQQACEQVTGSLHKSQLNIWIHALTQDQPSPKPTARIFVGFRFLECAVDVVRFLLDVFLNLVRDRIMCRFDHRGDFLGPNQYHRSKGERTGPINLLWCPVNMKKATSTHHGSSHKLSTKFFAQTSQPYLVESLLRTVRRGELGVAWRHTTNTFGGGSPTEWGDDPTASDSLEHVGTVGFSDSNCGSLRWNPRPRMRHLVLYRGHVLSLVTSEAHRAPKQPQSLAHSLLRSLLRCGWVVIQV